VLVFDIEEKSDEVDADFEGLNRRLVVLGFLSIGGLLGCGRLTCRSLGDNRNLGRGERSGRQKE
jgi:hypothetical protein